MAIEADLVFLTQDTEFADLPAGTAATVLIEIVGGPTPLAHAGDGPRRCQELAAVDVPS